MPFYLGIDGGGTQTTCAVGDEAQVLGTATTAGSNPVRLGEAVARQHLHGAIVEACAHAGISPRQVDAAVIGVAGASVREYADGLRRLAGELVSGRIEVVGDNMIALEAAFAGGPGVVVIAGTGSIAFGRNVAGETARAGGYGFEISDEGSGHWIGRRAVAAALRAHDSGDDSLLNAILAMWKLASLEQLVQVANGTPRPDFSQLFRVVLAGRGAEAYRILDEAGHELGYLAAIAIRRLFGRDPGAEVAIGGGVFAHSPQVRQTFSGALKGMYPKVSVRHGIIQPVTGALWLARRGAATHA
jgi:glucosamine kinase